MARALLHRRDVRSDLVEACHTANTALFVLQEAGKRGVPVGELVARAAWNTASQVLDGTGIALDTAVFDREGRLIGSHALPLKRR
jgi:cobalt-precorrin-5B (C1)-methyltransferase